MSCYFGRERPYTDSVILTNDDSRARGPLLFSEVGDAGQLCSPSDLLGRAAKLDVRSGSDIITKKNSSHENLISADRQAATDISDRSESEAPHVCETPSFIFYYNTDIIVGSHLDPRFILF